MPAIAFLAPILIGTVGLTAIGSAVASVVGLSIAAGTISAGAALAIGSGVVSAGVSLAQGRSISDALKSAVIGGVVSFAGGAIAGEVTSGIRAEAIMNGDLSFGAANSIGSVAGAMARGATTASINAAISGRDPLEALLKGGLSAGLSAGATLGANEVTSRIPGFADLSKDYGAAGAATQRAITAGLAAGILGKDIDQSVVNSVLGSVMREGSSYIREGVIDLSSKVQSAFDSANQTGDQLNQNSTQQKAIVDDYKNSAADIESQRVALQGDLDKHNRYKIVIDDIDKAATDQGYRRMWNPEEGFIEAFISLDGTDIITTESFYNANLKLANEYAKAVNDKLPGYESARTAAETKFSKLSSELDVLKGKATELEGTLVTQKTALNTSVMDFQTQEESNAQNVIKTFNDTLAAKTSVEQALGKPLTDEQIQAFLKTGDVTTAAQNYIKESRQYAQFTPKQMEELFGNETMSDAGGGANEVPPPGATDVKYDDKGRILSYRDANGVLNIPISGTADSLPPLSEESDTGFSSLFSKGFSANPPSEGGRSVFGDGSGVSSGLFGGLQLVAIDDKSGDKGAKLFDAGNGFALIAYSDGTGRVINRKTQEVIWLDVIDTEKIIAEVPKTTETPPSTLVSTTTPAADETSNIVVTPKTLPTLDVETAIDPVIKAEADARATLQAIGIDNPTDAQVEAVVDQSAKTQDTTSVTPAITPLSVVTPAPVVTPVNQTTGATELTGTAGVTGTVGVDGITPAQVAQIVNDALAANPNLTAAQVQTIVETAQAKTPSITIADVQNLINNIPASLTTTQIQAIIDGSELATNTSLNNAKTDLTKAIADLAAGTVTSLDDVKTSIADLKAAGLTEAQVQALVDAGSVNVSLELKTAIDAAIGQATTATQTQIAEIKTALETAVAEAKATGLLGDAALKEAIDTVARQQNTDAAALLSKLGTTETGLKTEFATQLAGVSTQIDDVKTALLAEVQAAKDVGLQGDAALQAGLDSLSAKLGINQTEVLNQLGTTVNELKTEFSTGLTDLSTQVNTQYEALTTAQKQTADDLIAQGISTKDAISAASAGIYKTLAAQEATRIKDAADAKAAQEESARQAEATAASNAALAKAQAAANARNAQIQTAGTAAATALQQFTGTAPTLLQQATQETNTPIYGKAIKDFNFSQPFDFNFFKPSDEKLGTKATQPTKIASGGYLDDLLAEQMSVDDLLKLLR